MYVVWSNSPSPTSSPLQNSGMCNCSFMEHDTSRPIPQKGISSLKLHSLLP